MEGMWIIKANKMIAWHYELAPYFNYLNDGALSFVLRRAGVIGARDGVLEPFSVVVLAVRRSSSSANDGTSLSTTPWIVRSNLVLFPMGSVLPT